jgi:hypothetical protein
MNKKPRKPAVRVPGPAIKDPNDLGTGQSLKKGRPVENAGDRKHQNARTLGEFMAQPLLPTAVDALKKKRRK